MLEAADPMAFSRGDVLERGSARSGSTVLTFHLFLLLGSLFLTLRLFFGTLRLFFLVSLLIFFLFLTLCLHLILS